VATEAQVPQQELLAVPLAYSFQTFCITIKQTLLLLLVETPLALADLRQLERRAQPQALEALFKEAAVVVVAVLLALQGQLHVQAAQAERVAGVRLGHVCIFMLHQR
jgi:hypothetical protein